VQSVCQRIILRQKDQSDATLLKFRVRRVSATSAYTQYLGGDIAHSLDKSTWWQPGDIAGYIETNSSSATFSQIEEP
jgi:hypothetical protein